jgi:hypothetical protein
MAKKSETTNVPTRPVHEVTLLGDRVQFQPLVPAGRETVPSNVRDALTAARDVLVDEDRWLKGSWFQNEHPEVDPEDAYCNDWSACLQAVIGLVTVGAHRRFFDTTEYYRADGTYIEPEDRDAVEKAGEWSFMTSLDEHANYDALIPGTLLYKATVRHVVESLPNRDNEVYDDEAGEYITVPSTLRWSSIPEFNDAGMTSRTNVMEALETIIADAPTDDIPTLATYDEVS